MSGLQALTSALAHSVWQLALAALVLAAVLRVVPARRSSIRYFAACGALLFQLLAPAITFLLLRAPIAPIAPIAPVAPIARLIGDTGSNWIPLLWAIGVQLMLLRVAFGLVRIRAIEASATPIPDAWRTRFEAIANQLELGRKIRWLATNTVPVPMTVGALRPIVYVPVWALTGIPANALELIVAHELAHVRRWDYAVNLAQSIIEALYFFHPAVWWVSKQMRDEREACCDDAVVESFGDPLAYARALTCLEESRVEVGALLLASSGGSFMQRIQRLFDPQHDRRTGTRWLGAAMIATALTLAAWTTTALAEHFKEKSVTLAWLPPTVQQYRSLIEEAAARHQVDANLLAVMMLVESGGDPTARSPSGARGLLQLMPKTAERIAKERGLAHSEAKLDEPAYNLDLGAFYLAQQRAQFTTDDEAIAAYNGGPEHVRAWLKGQRALSAETSGYKDLVTGLFRDESSLVYANWRARSRERSAKAAINPVPAAKISFAFGPQVHPIKKEPYVHQGIDLAAPNGSPVSSPLDGVVLDVSSDAKRGNVVVVRHRGGIETSYHHLGSVSVRPDQKLAQGELLGTVRESGETTGPHVHFEVRDLGEAIDPQPFVD